MAIRQKLKGNQNNPALSKTYDVLINFDRGIDRKTADDISNDSSFRKLTNFWNEKEGVLSKRPGLYDTNFSKMMEELYSIYYPSEGTRYFCNTFLSSHSIPTNICKSHISDLYSIFCQWTEYSDYTSTYYKIPHFSPTDLLYYQVTKDYNFHTLLENYDFSEGANNRYGENGIPSEFEAEIILVVGGNLRISSEPPEENFNNINDEFSEVGDTSGNSYNYSEALDCNKGLYIWKIHFGYRPSLYGFYSTFLDIDQVDCAHNFALSADLSNKYTIRWKYDLDFKKTLSLASYNGYTYITTGTDYLIKIQDSFPMDNLNYSNPIPSGDELGQTPLAKEESTLITQIGGSLSEIYRPTPVEVSNIGFNILAKDPLDFINTGEGSTDSVKGIYYSVLKNGIKEPISTIPPNAPFQITIMSTGSSTPELKYRLNNGDTDTTTNPYIALPGSLSGSVFNCDGINVNDEIEIKVKKGTSEFITYVSTGSAYNQETGLVQDIKKLVFSSSHIKVIGNQLVLFGGHGYIFFSEYDNFKYFPNYFFLYITSEAGEEEVTNIKYFRQYYAVFTNKRIKRMTGSFGSDNFGIYPLNDFVGCPNGDTIQQVNNNLLFLNIDGLYRLKQGYIGEGTENVEKIDDVLGNELSSNNVAQAFVLGNFYIMVRNDKNSLTIYDFSKDAFFEFDLEEKRQPIKYNPKFDPADNETGIYKIPTEFETDLKNKTYGLCFQNVLFDEYGASLYVTEYDFNYEYHNILGKYSVIVNKAGVMIRCLRLSDLSFISEELRHKDGLGFISELETPKLNMGSPTNTKKFKEIYIKMINENSEPIPLYITIYIDDVAYISPEDYEVRYDSDTNTYYYIYKQESNVSLLEGAEILNGQEVLGTITLGEDKLGQNTVYQLKIKINKKGRTIKIKLSDGYNNYSDLVPAETTNPDQTAIVTYQRYRNTKNFSIIAMGIVYKLKKVKEG